MIAVGARNSYNLSFLYFHFFVLLAKVSHCLTENCVNELLSYDALQKSMSKHHSNTFLGFFKHW